MTGTIWIDVEDIFVFAESGRTPTGIQRLSFELARAMREADGAVRLVRQTPDGGFAEIPWDALDRLFQALASPTEPAPTDDDEEPSDPSPVVRRDWRDPVRRLLRPALRRVPRPFQRPLVQFGRMQARAIYAVGDLICVLLALIFRAPPAIAAPTRTRIPAEPPPKPADMPWQARPGDIIFATGAAWFHADYAGLLQRACRKRGMRVALLIYDIIPVRRPEWCDRGHVEAFGRWLDAMLPVCDSVFTISDASAADIHAYARSRRLVLRDTLHPIPIGSGFHSGSGDGPRRALPRPGSYVLLVSTIEIRKNHILMFRIWRNLLEMLPAEDVPTLVFAGKIGWLVQDFLQQLRNCAYLDGKIVLVEQPGDADLAALYRGCLFTVFPSFYEGWGLPVSESLAFGKPCVIADRTSLPEAGGALARYFDPDDLAGATRVIHAILEDRPGLAAWEARVGQQFRHVTWGQSAASVMAVLRPQVPVRRSA